MTTLQYFAYGSNMSLARLQARVPSALRIGTYHLKAHQLRFHKSGRDGSGKCDAFETNNIKDEVFGALFNIHERDKPALDRAEGLGLGYSEKNVELYDGQGGKITAFTYYAIHLDCSMAPFSWYLNHVIIGARESQLPKAYLAQIEKTHSTPDHDNQRDAQQRAIHRHITVATPRPYNENKRP